ncbi:flagellin [Cupriavidus basilensis]
MAGRTPATQDNAARDPAPQDSAAVPPAPAEFDVFAAAVDEAAPAMSGADVATAADTREALPPAREAPPAAAAPRPPDVIAAAPALTPPQPPISRGAAPGARAREAALAAAAPSGAQDRPEGQAPPARAARSIMASWKPVEQDRLDDLRGGFDVGSNLQVSFGIQRAVYINGDLVVATSLTIPNLSRITADQATRLAAALGVATGAGAAAVNNALASHPATAGNGGNGSSNGGNGGSGSAGGSAGAAGTAMTSLPAAMVSAGAATVTTNGVMSLIQNGPGNSAAASALAGSPATVIQNTLNNQSIQNLVTINAGVNTLQAFRAQVANQTLTNALLGTTGLR